MSSAPLRLPLLAAAGLLLLVTVPVLAQKPAWTPVAELLIGSLGEADPVRMADVMSRCTALNMILSGMSADIAPDMAEHYKGEAHRFIQNNVLIESQLVKEQTGVEADIQALSTAAIEEVQMMVAGYNQWLDANIAADGSYFSKDIDTEIDSCQLASKLASQMNSGSVNSGSE